MAVFEGDALGIARLKAAAFIKTLTDDGSEQFQIVAYLVASLALGYSEAQADFDAEQGIEVLANGALSLLPEMRERIAEGEHRKH